MNNEPTNDRRKETMKKRTSEWTKKWINEWFTERLARMTHVFTSSSQAAVAYDTRTRCS